MSAQDTGGIAAYSRQLPANVILVVFTAALFVSAALLFAVQPMFAKLVLPKLGGSPAVWSVAMCFFQAALLAGYAYAHALGRFAGPPLGTAIHLIVLLLAIVALPIGIATGWTQPPEQGQHLWVFGLFAASIGLPFFALAGNAPLLQAWFARTDHPHARDPYFLYGASNLGSMLALLAYPVLLEPNLALAEQGRLWSLAYQGLIVLIAAAGALALLGGSRQPILEPVATVEVAAWDRFAWMALAFVPAGLLVAVTSYISTDIAAIPLLWIVPLALYLLTFVITFQRRPLLPHWLMLAVQPAIVALLIVSMQLPFDAYWGADIVLHLLAFFVSAMVCHGELVRRRPPAVRLTAFYLWMSIGGALGGLFAGLAAPNIFSTVVEYPLLIVLALLARPGLWPLTRRKLVSGAALGVLIVGAALFPRHVLGLEIATSHPNALIAFLILCGVVILLAQRHTARLTALAAATLLAGQLALPESAKGESIRSFFGVSKMMVTSNGAFRMLVHGTTLHGAQYIGPNPDVPLEPLVYYHRGGPFAQVIAAMRWEYPLRSIAVVGLGAGSLACYKQPHENWSFFEIDAVVIRIATDPSRFRFLSQCAPDARIVTGDARLTLAKEEDRAYDLIVLDAFSSDAIPVHLLTTEAVRLYAGKLADGGVLAFHVSNRHMDLAPVLAAVANEIGLRGLYHRAKRDERLHRQLKTDASVVLLASSPQAFGILNLVPGWERLPAPTLSAWTDDYSNVIAAILARIGNPPEEVK